MKKIDTWLEIERYVSTAAASLEIPRETDEFMRVDIGEISDLTRSRYPLVAHVA